MRVPWLTAVGFAVATAWIATPAAARDKLSRTVEVRVALSGSLSLAYEPEPPPETIAIGPFGNYRASWSWTTTETTTYRRSKARGEYADRTVVEYSSTLSETTDVGYRSGTGQRTRTCPDGGGTQTTTQRRVYNGDYVGPPRPGYRYTVLAGNNHPTGCGSPDASADSAYPGGGLENICVWTCTLPAGKRTHGVNLPTHSYHGLGKHQRSASYSVSVVVSTQRSGDKKKVRHRWQSDF